MNVSKKDVAIFQIEDMLSRMNRDRVESFGAHFDNGHDFIELMENVLELLKGQKWNLLKEDADGVIHGLPGDDDQYLMTDGKDIWIDDYVDGVADGIILDSGRDIREITAWMHMPELPKKDRR